MSDKGVTTTRGYANGEARKARATVIAALITAVVAAATTALSLFTAIRVNELTTNSVSAERFHSAGEQLASGSSTSRIVGLHGLRALGQDDIRYAERSAQIVASFIRLNTVPVGGEARAGDRAVGSPRNDVDSLELATAYSHLNGLSQLARQDFDDGGERRFAYDIAHVLVQDQSWRGSFSNGGYFQGTVFSRTDLDDSHWRCVVARRTVFGEGTSLDGARFEFVDLTGATFSRDAAKGLDPENIYWEEGNPPSLPSTMMPTTSVDRTVWFETCRW